MNEEILKELKEIKEVQYKMLEYIAFQNLKEFEPEQLRNEIAKKIS